MVQLSSLSSGHKSCQQAGFLALFFSWALFFALDSACPAWADTACYEVTFEAVWSPETHPHDFPSGPHFSGLIGGTHNSDVSFWRPGGLATNGIEAMAESGSTGGLRSEVSAAIANGTASSVIAGPGIARSPGVARVEFDVTDTHSLVTLVSMIAPSPD